MKSKLLKALIYVGVPVLIVLIAVLVKTNLDKRADQLKTALELANKAGDEATSEVAISDEPEVSLLEKLKVEIPEKDIDWKELEKTNKDVYAWLYVPGTKIDYPVLQHPGDDDYYLAHNLDNSDGKPGCIYSQTYNTKTFEDPMTVLYGHNMKDGSMFASLQSFRDSAFFDENRFFYIYTPGKTFVYEIFGAYENGDEHLLLMVDTNTFESYTYYLQQIFNRDCTMSEHVRSEDELGLVVTGDSKVVTLSTCIKGQEEKRWLVQGVLVGVEEN